MKQYNPLDGVPAGFWYVEYVQFADFEVPEKTQILFISKDKQELIDHCRNHGLECREAENSKSGWVDHFIKYRG
jgi:hypothetical protein